MLRHRIRGLVRGALWLSDVRASSLLFRETLGEEVVDATDHVGPLPLDALLEVLVVGLSEAGLETRLAEGDPSKGLLHLLLDHDHLGEVVNRCLPRRHYSYLSSTHGVLGFSSYLLNFRTGNSTSNYSMYFTDLFMMSLLEALEADLIQVEFFQSNKVTVFPCFLVWHLFSDWL